MNNKEQLQIRPYARLLVMLGDQLIKDEIIAILELIKNSYDADAENVFVRFENFSSEFEIQEDSSIVIEDDGNGMSEEILKSAWMNPATPDKIHRKKVNLTTDKGRIMQGEKGIGRFAIFKLGRNVQIITRRQKYKNSNFIDQPDSENEFVLTYDFSDFDDDFLRKKSNSKDVFLDEIKIDFETICPAENIIKKKRKPYGTIIKISNLIGSWNKTKIEKLYQNILRMQPIFSERFIQDFKVVMSVNDIIYKSEKMNLEDLQVLLNEKSVLIVEGCFKSKEKKICFNLDNHNNVLKYEFFLNDPELRGIKNMTSFLDEVNNRELECGSFGYKFYILDLNVKIKDNNTRFYLNKDEIELVKSHRVYLYRDGVRVMPYGDPEDDWLQLDMIRGTVSAADIFGNDQIVGYISITQKENPKLKDKTNREGLIEEGNAREDLVNICKLILRYLRAKPYAQYLIDKKNRNQKNNNNNSTISEINIIRNAEIGKKYVKTFLDKYGNLKINKKDIDNTSLINDMRSSIDNNFVDDKLLNGLLDDVENKYLSEKNVLENRISTVEDLAAIGLSAETAYHDARILLSQVNNYTKNFLKDYRNNKEEILYKSIVIKDIEHISKQIDTVQKLMSNVQKLFPSTKNKKTNVNVNKTISKVKELYAMSLEKAGISCSINCVSSKQMIVECTDAVLLQVFINLFDNSLYWLKTVGIDRTIYIQINSDNNEVIFSDNGPGVRKEDEPYIFEPFYSGKGEDGKGLGLYIARQLLERYNADIKLIDDGKEKLLGGANFMVGFKKETE